MHLTGIYPSIHTVLDNSYFELNLLSETRLTLGL